MKKEHQDRSSGSEEGAQSELEARIEQLENVIRLEKKARQTAEKSLADLRADGEAQALVVTGLEERLEAEARAQGEIEKLRKDVEERLNLALQELEEERSARTQVQKRLAVALGTQGSSKEELLEEHARLKKELAEASQRLDWKEQERSRLEFQLAEARKLLTQVKGGEAGSALLSERLIDARKRVSTLETEKERAEAKLAVLKREQAEIQEQQVQQADLWAQREKELQGEIGRLESALSGERFQELQSERESLESEVASLKQALEEKGGEQERGNRERRRLEDLLKDKRNEVESLQQRTTKLEEKLRASDSSRKDAEKELERARAVQKALQAEFEQNHAHPQRKGATRSPGKVERSPGAGAVSRLIAVLAGLVIGGGTVFAAFHLLLERSGQGGAIDLVQKTFSPAIETRVPPPEAAKPVAATVEEAQASSSESASESAPAPPSVAVTAAPDTVAGKAESSGAEAEQPAMATISSELRDPLRGGGLGPQMVGVPGGSFLMGSERDMLATEERPVHEVTLPPFYVSRYEITFEEYDRFARAMGRPLPDDRGWGRGSRPVIHISWKDAQDYTLWLSRVTGKTYRLASEAEWEYAARAGTDTFFWWGYEVGSNNANCFDCGSSWDFRSTAPVGSFEANPFGLYDTAGNVQEWVADCYNGNYEGAPSDGSAWLSGDCSRRVTRGGAFDKPAERMQVYTRSALAPDLRLGGLGFRVVREP